MRRYEEARKLLSKAAEDDVILDKHISDHEVTDAIWGFHAQQSAEKIFKAVLIAKGIEYPKTHDLVALYELLESHQDEPPVSANTLAELSPYAVNLRYEAAAEDELLMLDRVMIRREISLLHVWAKERTK